jgi:hypothetical protein
VKIKNILGLKGSTQMKKLFAMLMVLVMGLSLVACGGQESDPPAEGSKEPAAAAEGSVYWLNFKPESDAALQEIAKMLNVPEGTVKSRLYYGRKKLEEMRQKEEGENKN